MSHILIAEDEPRIATFLEKGLRSNGFTTTAVSSGLEALDLTQNHSFDLLILDLGLPEKDGLEVLEELRGQGQTLPIIILTARDDIHDKVAGLEGGADDYVTKPFRFEELLARVRLRLRRMPAAKGEEQSILRAGTISLNLRTRQVTVGDVTLELPAREFTLWQKFFFAIPDRCSVESNCWIRFGAIATTLVLILWTFTWVIFAKSWAAT